MLKIVHTTASLEVAVRCELERVSSFSSAGEFVARTVSRFLFFWRVSAVKKVFQYTGNRNFTQHANIWLLVFLLLRRLEKGGTFGRR